MSAILFMPQSVNSLGRKYIHPLRHLFNTDSGSGLSPTQCTKPLPEPMMNFTSHYTHESFFLNWNIFIHINTSENVVCQKKIVPEPMSYLSGCWPSWFYAHQQKQCNFDKNIIMCAFNKSFEQCKKLSWKLQLQAENLLSSMSIGNIDRLELKHPYCKTSNKRCTIVSNNKSSQWLPNTPFASISECLVS